MRKSRPSGDAHWTRAWPDLLPSWTKLKPDRRAELIARFKAGERADDLAREFRIGRTTAWRYLCKEGLIKKRLVSSVSRVTATTDELWMAYRELKSTKKVAERFGTTHSNVIQRLHNAGYSTRGRGRKWDMS